MLSARLLSGSLLFALLGLCTSAAAFSLDDVTAKAKALADQPYKAPKPIPQFLRELTYRQYQDIRFRPGESLWHESDTSFQILPVPAGAYYGHTVKLHEVNAQGIEPIEFDKNRFDYPSEAIAKRIPPDLGYAGFKLTFPMKTPTVRNQFLVFAGASYLRGVGSDNTFGLSARGVAIDTGLPSGEEYPSFVEFWLERPSPNAKSIVIYALLDGPSATGAYRFVVNPGKTTDIDVTARLFFRQDVNLLGLAPLTSMFYYGEHSVRPLGEWRPEVHDSDGLLIHNGASGEWLWRPLLNPRNLRMSYLQTENVRGFGLMQRQTDFSDYEDMEARYDLRPSAWVQPRGDWGKGDVVLVEIPTRAETNDNIVAFWHPKDPVTAGQQRDLSYTLSFGGPDIAKEPSGAAVQTFVGNGNRIGGGDAKGAYRIIVDFAGGALDNLSPDAAVVSRVSGGDNVEVLEHFAEYIAPEKRWRLSMLVRPAQDAPLSVRAYLSLKDEPLTETWTYDLPADADIRSKSP